MLAEVEEWRLDSAERLELLRVISHFFFRYADHVSAGLAEIHQAERDRQIRGREHRRIAWVREVLADVTASNSNGDYDLDRDHLAAIAWGAEAESAVSDLAQRLGAALVAVPGQSGAVWAWFGARSIAASWPEAVSESPPAGQTFVALGTPAPGAEGFRRSHREALEAARVVRLTGAPVGLYDAISLEALMPRDERAARDFMRRELGPLLEGGKRVEILLETLQAYVKSGWNAASTGALLGVHERTIGYRLATIEQRLGHPLAARRDEVGVALRLHTALSR